MDVKLRPLELDDARTSVKWRNTPAIWAMTGAAPDRLITLEDEIAWLGRVIQDPSCRRFAIIAEQQYVGNIYLTGISENAAEYHIFIGERQYWGKGVARQASIDIIDYARSVLGLQRVDLKVRCQHDRAISLYESLGFARLSSDGECIRMTLDLQA